MVVIMLLAFLEELGISQVEPFFEGAGEILMSSLIGIFLMVGLVGLYIGYAEPVGAIGKTGIVLSALAGGLRAVAGVGQMLNVEIDFVVLLGLFFVVLPGGMLLFGYATLQSRALPRWNALPLLIGATAVVTTPAVAGIAPQPVGIGAYLLSGVGWILLGLVLRADTGTTAAATMSTSG